MTELAAAVREYYDQGGEVDRLQKGGGRLEFLRTRDVLRRLLPPAPADVLDVGGGTGVHARWLAADGHRVTVVDPVPLHVEHAAAIAGVRAQLGDARRLAQPDAGFDVVLLLGPMYHLTERPDRVAALREAARVTRPGGLVAAATISRFAGMFDSLDRCRYLHPAARVRSDATVASGVHDPGDLPDLFTLAYFHHPDEVPAEFADAGLPDAERYLLEGPASLIGTLDRYLDDDANAAVLVEALRQVEREPTLFGASPHLLTVASRP